MNELEARSNEMGVRLNETNIAEKRTPELIGSEIRMYVDVGRRVTLLCGIEIGRRLVEVKGMLDHGEWLPWLERETEFTDRSAQRYMKLFDEYGSYQLGLFGPETNTTTLSNLPISKAFALLSLPESERETFAEEVDAEHISVRDLQKAIREKTEAEEKLKKVEESLDAYRKEAVESTDAMAKKNQTISEQEWQLTQKDKKIKELENRPVEVVVERDEKAIEEAAQAAKDQTVKEYEKTVNDLNKKLLQAEKERDALKTAAESGAAETENKIKEANRETERIRAELEAAKKQLKAASADVAAFGIWFGEVQKSFSAMMEEYRKIAERSPETAGKLKNGITQLLTQLATAAEG